MYAYVFVCCVFKVSPYLLHFVYFVLLHRVVLWVTYVSEEPLASIFNEDH